MFSRVYNSLQEYNVSKQEYAFARSVWQKSKVKDLNKYDKLDCRIDILLLTASRCSKNTETWR